MILRRYLVRETLAAFAAVLATLMLVVVANRFAHFLAAAAAGRMDHGFILELLALKSADALTPLLPAAVFAALLLSLGRLARDGELVAMAAGGIGRGGLARMVLAVGLGAAVAAGALSLAAAPLVNERYEALRTRAHDSADLANVVAGRFTRFGRGESVFYSERIAGERRTMEEVFMHATSPDGREELVRAAHAFYRTGPGGRFVVLEDGRRYQGAPGGADWSITRFARYTVRVREDEARARAGGMDSMPTARLWQARGASAAAAAELQWRLSQPVLTLVLAALALGFSLPGPDGGRRRDRFERLLLAVLAYLAYLGLVVSATAGVESGILPAAVGVWPVHAAFAVAAALLLIRPRAGRRRRDA